MSKVKLGTLPRARTNLERLRDVYRSMGKHIDQIESGVDCLNAVTEADQMRRAQARSALQRLPNQCAYMRDLAIILDLILAEEAGAAPEGAAPEGAADSQAGAAPDPPDNPDSPG